MPISHAPEYIWARAEVALRFLSAEPQKTTDIGEIRFKALRWNIRVIMEVA